MSEHDCVVKIIDEHDVVHRVRVKASSLYEAALIGLQRLKKVGWEGDYERRTVTVENWDAPAPPSLKL